MPLPFTPLIEEVGNRILRLDPETLRRLGDLQGRVVCIEFRDLGRKIYLHPSESGFRLATEYDQTPAVTLRGTLATFARLGLGTETETLKAGEFEIEGDAALGQRLQRMLAISISIGKSPLPGCSAIRSGTRSGARHARLSPGTGRRSRLSV